MKRDIKDAKAHIDLQKGCQTLDGKNALGYVRARYSDPKGDLGRAERQRQFLGAVMKQAATPSTVLIPTRWWGFTHTAASSVIVGEDTSLLDTYRILSTMRKVSSDEALSLVVPLSSTNTTTRAGSSVIWDDERADALFTMLREGEPIEEPPAGHRRPARAADEPRPCDARRLDGAPSAAPLDSPAAAAPGVRRRPPDPDDESEERRVGAGHRRAASGHAPSGVRSPTP